MKIEFLYKDNSYKGKINKIKKSLDLDEKNIVYTPVVQAGLNIFSFEKENDNETVAKELDEIKNEVVKVLSNDNLFIITDGAASYFCQRLYPLVANFERNLRKILYIASLKSNDTDGINLCKKIHKLEFAEIYQVLFSDSSYLMEARKVVNSKSPEFSKYDIIRQLKDISEHNLWNKLFNGAYSYISDNFLKIKDGRNHVMHSHDISYDEFSKIKKHLEKCEEMFKKIECDLLDKEIYNSDENFENISNALLMLGKVVLDVTSNEVVKSLSTFLGKLLLERLQGQPIGVENTNELANIEPIDNCIEKINDVEENKNE